MSTYFIGDVHGCYKNLKSILNCVHFNPDIDYLYLTGDLVSRGPNSLEVLRLIRSFNKSACTVLGNHDLYLLKEYFSINYNNRNKNCFSSILQAPDIKELMDWLRQQPILYIDKNKKIIICHAGINPQWNIQQAQSYAQEIEKILTSNNPNLLFSNISEYSNIDHNLNLDKLKETQSYINFFTKMRYVYLDGKLNLQYKNSPEFAPKNIYPWFSLSKHIVPEYNIIFGHWASLKNTTIKIPNGFYGLDSGCCWGEYLTLLRWEDKQITRIPCNPPA